MQRVCVLALAGACAAQQINIDWRTNVRVLTTAPAFQTVVNPLITRQSPIHEQVYASIAAMIANATNIGPLRFVPWLPYPNLGVAELEPPSGDVLCGFRSTDDGGFPLYLSCGSAGTIASVDFASYGTPTGFCGSLALGTCNSPNSVSAVTEACVGKPSCYITSNNTFFGGDPCVNTPKSFAVQVKCSAAGAQHTYWNFTYLNALMEDFMSATGNEPDGTKGADVIINFSTSPEWLWATPDRVAYPDDPNGEVWSYEQGSALRDTTAKDFGAYYGRLLAYYTQAGFADEYGANVTSPYRYNISHWECLNEPEGEHVGSGNPQLYTQLYDAMVTSMRATAPFGTATMQFMGLALEDHNEFNWYSYFFDSSNHAPAALPLQWASMHFYCIGKDRTNATTYLDFFNDADGFVTEMKQVIQLRDALAPGVKLDADEVGVILPNDNSPAAAPIPPIYWNAAAAMYCYLFGQLALLGMDVIGESQLMGYPQLGNFPPQFPSVTMLNWTTGAGNARYWALKLLVDNTMRGDDIVSATVAPPASNTFCGTAQDASTLQLLCTSGVISSIAFASYGTPSGSCPGYAPGGCSASNSSAVVASFCVGSSACSVPVSTSVFGDPCPGTPKQLTVVATCSGGGGGYSPSASASVFVQAYLRNDGSKRLMIVNKDINPTTVQLPQGSGTGSTWTYVDESTGDSAPARTTLTSDTVSLSPWAVGFVLFAA